MVRGWTAEKFAPLIVPEVPTGPDAVLTLIEADACVAVGVLVASGVSVVVGVAGVLVGSGVSVVVGVTDGVAVAVGVTAGAVAINDADGWLPWPSSTMMLCCPIDAERGIVKTQPLFTLPVLFVPQLELRTVPAGSTSKNTVSGWSAKKFAPLIVPEVPGAPDAMLSVTEAAAKAGGGAASTTPATIAMNQTHGHETIRPMLCNRSSC